MELLDLLARRRMTRSFSGDAIDHQRLDELCVESLRAPTAGNSAGVRMCTVPREQLPGYFAAPGGPGLPCPAGSFCIQGSMRPAPCPPGTVSAVGSSTCLILPSISQGLQGYDWIVASTWFVVAFLGVGCVMRTQTRRRAR